MTHHELIAESILIHNDVNPNKNGNNINRHVEPL